MLTLWVDTFITLEDADTYIKDNFEDNSSRYTKWFNISDRNREVWLRRSTKALNRLKYNGSKVSINQSLEFPRRGETLVGGYYYSLYVDPRYDNQLISINDSKAKDDGGKKIIGEATIENAIAGIIAGETIDELNELNIRGITSKKIGPISESYNRNNLITKSAIEDIFTPKVYSILNKWLRSSRGSI